MKKLTSLFLFIVLAHICMAQHVVSGYVLDKENQALPYASIVISDIKDSAMITFGMTNDNGLFKIDVEEQGDYYLQVSFIGFSTLSIPLTTDWSTRKIELGNIKLSKSTTELMEVKVETERIPMGIMGDTIVYDANAFKTRDGASVEELLRQLPGIEVERDGSIKAQGEDVRKVLVDGKQFFGEDPKIATKNLEAEAVDKVEVFDKKSEIAEFTGIDDGEEEKTINLKLKEDHKKGGFGRVNLAAGNKETYRGKLNYNRFSPTTQTSIIANSNNINEQAFTFEEYIGFMGGLSNVIANSSTQDFGAFAGGGQTQGINTNHSVGANFNHDFNEKLSLNTHYFYLQHENDLNKTINSTNFTGQDVFNSQELNLRNSRNRNHRFNAKLKWKRSPFMEITFSNNFRNGSTRLNNKSITSFIPSTSINNNTQSDLLNTNGYLSWNSQLLLKKKFQKKGRNWISGISFDLNNDDQVNDILTTTFGLPLDQFQDFVGVSRKFNVNSNYTEPLGKRWYTVLGYEYNRDWSETTRIFYDVEETIQLINNNLSGTFNRLVQQHDGKLRLKKNAKKLKTEAGIVMRDVELQVLADAPRNFNYALPLATMRLELRGGSEINFSYFTGTTIPRLGQLITIPNNLDPNRNFVGNSSLIPEYAHTIRLRYNYFDNFSFTSLFLNLSASKVQNRIVQQTTVNTDFTLNITPFNTDFFESARASFGFSSPIKRLKIKYNIDGNINISNYNSWLNGQITLTGDQSYFVNLSIENRNKKNWHGRMGVRLNWSARSYAINDNFNQNFSNYDWYAEMDMQLKADLLFTTGYIFQRYSDEFFSSSQQVHLVNASIRKSFNQDKWSIKLSVNDLLNQTLGINRSGTDNGLREETFNIRRQFFMVELGYKIGNKKSKNQNLL